VGKYAMELFRFGLFDFDPKTGVLRREGIPVHLQAQPAQVLGALLAHADEVVTREFLREVVWRSETHVDFDRGLNFCIAQIRSALGDSADSPRYVKTLPRRGYAFIAPVQGPPGPPPPPLHTRRNLARVLIPATGFAAAGAFLLLKRPWVRTSRPIVAVVRFDNQTGSPELDRFAEGLTDTLVGELTERGNGRYSVIGNAAILLKPRGFRDLNAIGDALHAGYVVLGQIQLGQIQRDAATVRVLAHLIRLPQQTHVAVERIDCDPTDPLRAQADLARRIATRFSIAEGGLT
jgi:DNA-binding winged helix-turn-helix (wHTH) protein/TolB-like protein